MKLQQLSNTKRSLMTFKNHLIKEIKIIENQIEEIEKTEASPETRCPKCYSRDIRYLKNGNIFCRGCGYDSKRKNDRI